MSQKFLTSLAILTLNSITFATEVDNFTNRETLTQDASACLNFQMDIALKNSAAKVKGCSQRKLEEAILAELGGTFFPTIESHGEICEMALNTPFTHSIYRDMVGIRYPMRMGAAAETFYTPYSVKLKNAVVGVDKFGHFLQNGYEMYAAVRKREDRNFKSAVGFFSGSAFNDRMAGINGFLASTPSRGDQLVLEYANFHEDTEWGMYAAGVKSYGDMVSDYEGYRFWMGLVEGSNPHFKCENSQWKLARPFDWNEYVNDGWDEANNCSTFASNPIGAGLQTALALSTLVNSEARDKDLFVPDVRDKAKARIKAIAPRGCPIQPDACIQLRYHYGEKAKMLLHPNCLRAR